MKIKFYLVILLLLPFFAAAQIIPLTNPSFEDIGGHSHVPHGWYDCGFDGESPPDILPDPQNTFQVDKLPSYDGNTYLGLVVRDNDTWESVTQRLPVSLEPDSCYTFSFYAARSENYISLSRTTELEANYNVPVIIRIFGGYDYCDFQEPLAATELIRNTSWKEFRLAFSPKGKYNYIMIEAYYNIPKQFAYNGNVLVDKVQLIKGCNKQDKDFINANKEIEISERKEDKVEKIDAAINIEKTESTNLSTPIPKTLEDLKIAIEKYGKYIHYDKDGTSLEKFDFTFDNKEYKNTNLYLAFIAKAMQQFPDYQLVISVNGKDYARYTRTINIENQLFDLGLDKDHCMVYPHNELDARREWLWIAADNDLLMQIIPIKK